MIVAFLFISALASLIPAFLHRVLFDRGIPDRNGSLIFPVALLICITESIAVSSRLIAEKALAEGSRRRRGQYRRNLGDRLWHKTMAVLECVGTGGALRHFDDAGLLADLRSRFLGRILRPGFLMLALTPAMFVIHPGLAGVRFITVVPSLYIGMYFLEQDLVLERRLWDFRRRSAAVIFQGIRALAPLKAGRHETDYQRTLRRTSYCLGETEAKRQLLSARWEAASTALGRIGAALSLAFAVRLIITGELSFGAYIAFSILAARNMRAFAEFLGGIRELARCSNAARRQRELFLAEDDYPARAFFTSRKPARLGTLEVCDLHFSYEAGKEILKGLNLQIRQGERILLRGGSGAGKSTLFSVLLGCRRPNAGSIYSSSVSLINCPPERRRLLIGAVQQDPVFFDATVRENLSTFAPPPADDWLWRALKAADAEDIVRNLSDGLDSPLSGEGSGLSGGQRQRLAIARLMVCPPPLVLLDEPLSALDPSTASIVVRSLEQLCRDRTVLVISHDENIPIDVHRIALMRSGRVEWMPS